MIGRTHPLRRTRCGRRFGALLGLVCLPVSGLAGCGDGLRPELRGASLAIFLDGGQYDEQTVAIGDVLELSARVLDATGMIVSGETVFWRTDQPGVATVEGDGVVVARGIGTAFIVARHDVGEDTARVNVAAPVDGPLHCEAADELNIAVGEVRSLAGPDAVRLCLPDGSGVAADYAIIAVNAANGAASVLPLHVQVNGVTILSGPPQPSQDRTGSTHKPRPTNEPVSDIEFHARIRGESSRQLEPLLRTGGSTAVGQTRQVGPASDRVPELAADSGPKIGLSQVGELITFNGSIDGEPCDSGPERTGRVRLLTQHAIIVEDTSNPAGGFTDADYSDFGEFFDAEAWPMVTAAFGNPSDIDQNGRTIIFFTAAVNQLPGNSNLPEHADSFIGGFFYNRDLFSVGSCEGSNAAEMLYLMVPDPSGESQPGGRRAFSAAFVRQRIPSLLVHELQHLVNDSRRLHVNHASMWEQVWLNEGLSHIAEELMFFRRAGLQPGLDLGAADLDTPEEREAFRAFLIDNLDRLTSFLIATNESSPLGPDELGTRGAIWSFLRYAADRYPGGETALWDRLVRDTRLSGLENLAWALGSDPREWVRDWAVAMYMDGTGVSADPRYVIRSWDFRALYPGLAQVAPPRNNHPYPIEVRRLEQAQSFALPIDGGGAAYLRAGVPAGGRAAVRVTVGETQTLPPPTRLKIAVVRLQ